MGIFQTFFDNIWQSHSAVIFLTQQWHDNRLSRPQHDQYRPNIFITSLDETKIWIPDTFFDNEITENDDADQFPDSNKFNSWLRIYPNGTVKFDRR